MNIRLFGSAGYELTPLVQLRLNSDTPYAGIGLPW
ncbi:MAG: hypothetical protein BECKG1743D_GA0114223_111332 [Candidatus Kentron sp. G]|nr:MAG: hypothetical protein BECKG1743F_GA0114225_111522 [Candidatus Kentron sp. G]VFN07158.1 MAG: hypothetical protein BECKG1743E_GA0114224_111462 [Candidatus Kentron sp. G]VFN07716.1 MAG: hypothetical protein BECKG1743D_GA0114223_111332 [Candidatus Kentron sp. G]